MWLLFLGLVLVVLGLVGGVWWLWNDGGRVNRIVNRQTWSLEDHGRRLAELDASVAQHRAVLDRHERSLAVFQDGMRTVERIDRQRMAAIQEVDRQFGSARQLGASARRWS